MNITSLIHEYANKRNYRHDSKTIKNLLIDSTNSLMNQDGFNGESEYLPQAIKGCVRSYSRDKGAAIDICRGLIGYLKGKGITVEIQFPTIDISNDFERLMFIAKYLQDPRHKISDLEDRLWVSPRTVDEDLKKLRGKHADSIQVCGKVFKIDDLDRSRGEVHFPSTAHPLFLTPNLTQVLVTLKGLKAMSEDSLYSEYAKTTAADIWEQLSDYAKTRIHFVLSELLPEDLSWYEGLHKEDDEHFYSERRCSPSGNVFLDCIKNGKSFCVEYKTKNGILFYNNCKYVPRSLEDRSFEVTTEQGTIRLHFDNIIKSAYSVEEMM